MTSLANLDKAALLADLISQLRAALAQVTAAQKASQAGSTHEDNRAEGDKDMRATEASYVARGQASRVIELRDELSRVSGIEARAFGPNSPVAAGALLKLLDERGQETLHLLMPGGAGLLLTGIDDGVSGNGSRISVISTRSPLGQALLGLTEGESVSLDQGDRSREWTLLEVR